MPPLPPPRSASCAPTTRAELIERISDVILEDRIYDFVSSTDIAKRVLGAITAGGLAIVPVKLSDAAWHRWQFPLGPLDDGDPRRAQVARDWRLMLAASRLDTPPPDGGERS